VPPIPRPLPSTLRAIQAALVEGHDDWESVGIAAGDVGMECDRALWLTFRRASAPEEIDWRKRRIFERGNIEEERLVDLLRLIGLEVWGQQDKVRAAGEHLRGKIDGLTIGLPEAPKTEHIVECKSAKADSFAKLKAGVRVGNPAHYATMQFYMHCKGLTRALYMCTNKDNEDLHLERVEYDAEFALRLIARVERVIATSEPPSRLCSKRDDFRGRFCKQQDVCWQEAWPRAHCRTCVHATALLDGNAAWDCARWSKPLSLAEQDEGCEAHLYIPALVPGEMLEVDEGAETIRYRLRNGKEWVDGRGKQGSAKQHE
jgi:hypothetical protein